MPSAGPFPDPCPHPSGDALLGLVRMPRLWPMRFLHLADIHLDTLFAGRDERVRERLRQGSREALHRGLALARKERVDAVVIAGDLFDGARLSFETERVLADEMAALAQAGIPLFVATGNHDPGGDLFDVSRLHAASGLHLFARATPETVPVWRGGELVGTVTGAGHASSREERDLSLAFVPPKPGTFTPGADVPALAVLHTQVGGARGDGNHDRYAPSNLAHLREAGFDYWALGHIHVRQMLSEFPAIHYPGNTAGRSPSETGAKGGLLVELPGRGLAAQVRFVELAPIRWERLEVAELAEAGSLQALIRQIRQRWEAARREDPGLPGGEWIIRVGLSGPLPLHGQLRDAAERSVLEGELREALGALDVEVRLEGARPPVNVEAGLRRQDAAGEALRWIQAFRQADGPSPSQLLGIGTGDLAGEVSGDALDDYLRGLLEGAEAELLARFLDEGEGGG